MSAERGPDLNGSGQLPLCILHRIFEGCYIGTLRSVLYVRLLNGAVNAKISDCSPEKATERGALF